MIQFRHLLVHQLLSDLLETHDLIFKTTYIVSEPFDLALGLLVIIQEVLVSQELLSLLQYGLSLRHEGLLAPAQFLYLNLVHLNLQVVEASLIGLLVFLNFIISIEDSNFFFQFFELVLDLVQHLLKLPLFAFSVINGFHHAPNLLIELGSTCDFLEHLEEACLTLVHELLDLALLHDLELGVAREREVAALEKVEQVLLCD